MQSDTQKISITEKIGFSLGDSAANFIFQTIMLLQLSFYTDTFGITAGAAAILFLVGRIYGAILDPIMGAVSDRTETRWGKYRPWILWTAVPFGIIGFFAFTTPNFESSGKLIYAFITYILLMTVYSMNNIPYSALSGVITGNQEQRTSLFSVRFIFVCLATIAIQGFAIPMVNHFGNGDSAKGYQITMGIFSALALLFFLFTFLTTKERIKPSPQQKQSLKQDIQDLLLNRPWLIMFSVFLMMFIFLAIRNGILLYFFRYYLDLDSMKVFMEKMDKGLFGLLGFMGFTGANADIAGSAFGFTNILGQVASIIGIFVSNWFTVRYGKKNVFVGGLILAMVFAAMFMIVSPTDIMMVMFLQILYNFAWGITMPLPWAMMADVADFGDWKNNRRATGMVMAGVVIGLKVGIAIGGALGGLLLSWYGYVPNAVQSATSLEGIRLTTSIYPSVALVIVIVLLFFYQINKKMELQMQNELAERRKAME